MSSLPRVAVIGYPNVGKSTLFNRITGTRDAVVAPQAGVTRDRKEGQAEWGGREFVLVDTGGLDLRAAEPLAESVRDQARQAIAESDAVIFLLDGRAGVGSDEMEIARLLRRGSAPVVLAVNKSDTKLAQERVHEFWGLGLGEPYPVSAEHGLGVGDLLDAVVTLLPPEPNVVSERPETVRVAIVGRPNVGKSSLLNALLGSDRVIVSNIPGTTRDSIDTELLFRDTHLTLVDTAGLRRKGRRAEESLEFYSTLRTMQSLERADVALVLADASEGLVDLDLQVAYEAQRARCATVVLFNKWDVRDLDLEKARERVGAKVQMKPPCIPISCVTGRNLDQVLPLVLQLHDAYRTRIATPALNRWLADIRARGGLPQRSGKSIKLFYVVQYSTAPPRFKLMVNSRALIHRNFAYYLENRLRDSFGLAGVPVIIDFEGKEERFS